MRLMVSYFKQKLLPYVSADAAFQNLAGILKTQTASQFVVISSNGSASPLKLAPPECVLDDHTIDQYLADIAEKGAFGGARANRMNLEVARRVTSRLGRMLSADLMLPPDAIAQALHYTIWTELCTLRPMRALAREISAKAGQRPVFIPLDLGPKTYFGFWDPNECEKFYLYHELNRRGALTAFFVDEKSPQKISSSVQDFQMSFSPSLHWKASTVRVVGQKAFVTNGIRAADTVMEALAKPAGNIPSDVNERSAPTGLEGGTELPTIHLTFKRTERLSGLRGSHAVFRAEIPTPPSRLITQTLGIPSKKMAQRTREIVSSLGITEAHICDHPFYESALIGGAVRDAGGKVILWPHSSNVMMMKMHRPKKGDVIHTITKNGAAAWRGLAPTVKVRTVSGLMLEPYEKPWPFVPSDPLNVVVIAGAHRLGRLPAFSYSGHLNTYRRLFSELSRYEGAIRVHCKAKAPWEDFQFIQNLTPSGFELEEVKELPSRIEMTNLVFLSVTVGSSALLEGMGRGIPCITVRETAAEDYVVVPNVLTTDAVPPILKTIADPSGWQQFVDQQSQCYHDQVAFNSLEL